MGRRLDRIGTRTRGSLMRTSLLVAGLLMLVGVTPTEAQAPTARTLTLSFDEGGRVTLVAQNVAVRDILAEWARQCGCYIVNADRMPGTLTMPVQFEQATQSDVLESLLRQAAGYVLTPKRAGSQGISNYETIFILATSNPVAGAYVPPPAAPVGPPPPTTGSPDDEIPPVMPRTSMPVTPPPVAAQPASSNPFGSRTSGPSAFEPSAPTPAAPAPGAPTTVPAQRPAPGRTSPVVPIVPVPPPGR